MPRFSYFQKAFTLIELMIGLALLAFLLVLAMPNFAAMLHNMKIRATADSITQGLQVARSEALKRNKVVEFVLTSDNPDPDGVAGYAIAAAGPNWAIRSVEGPGAYAFIEGRSVSEGSTGTQPAVQADNAGLIAFNSFGTLTPATAVLIAVSNPSGGACKTASGDEPMRCLNIAITSAGQVRMCDPSVDAAGDTRRC